MVDRSVIQRLGWGPSAEVREARDLLEELERRMSESLGLWQRESVGAQLRALRIMLRGLREVEAYSERAEQIHRRLEEIEAAEFGALRGRLASGAYDPKEFFSDLEKTPAHLQGPFARRVFNVEMAPLRQSDCSSEMIDNVPTNLATILEIVQRLQNDDLFFDIGSGVGTVVLITAFLARAQVRGVEIDPEYARFSRERAERFQLENLRIVNEDARTADYSGATAFFLYDPFRKAMMQEFIRQIEAIARAHPVRVFAFGNCGATLAEVDWLETREFTRSSMRVFQSIP